MKVCTKCHKDKGYYAFPMTGGGRGSICKECKSEYSREWYWRHRDGIKLTHILWDDPTLDLFIWEKDNLQRKHND